jgi:hypothetical protein
MAGITAGTGIIVTTGIAATGTDLSCGLDAADFTGIGQIGAS